MKTARRILITILVGAGLAFMSGPWKPAQAEVVYNAELVNDNCIGADTNYDLPLMDISVVSFVSTASPTVRSADTFTDGRKSTSTITVQLNSDLSIRKATATIDVLSASTTTLRGLYVNLNGSRFQAGAGGEWTPVTTATGNAVALAAAITAGGVFDAVATSTRIAVATISSGTYLNGWTITTNSTTVFRLNGGTAGSVNFIGGRDNARLAVNGVVFNAGTGFTVAATSSGTAKAISDAIMANSTLSSIISSTWTMVAVSSIGVVTATSTAVGENAYTLFTSTANALRLNGSASSQTGTFLNGSESKIDLTNDLINLGAHGYGTGLDVLFTVSGSTAPGGLTANTTYFVIKNDYDRVKLATTKANAAAGTAINLTTQLGGQTYTLTPLSRTGNASFKWQASNNSTFSDLSVSSVTITASTTSAWNFGSLPYKTLRLKYTAPTTGCSQVTATGTGTR